MNYTLHKEEGSNAIDALEIEHEDGTVSSFSALDIAYTICQNYKEALIGTNVYINQDFPETCLQFPLDTQPDSVIDELNRSGIDLYFDANGFFLFHGETEINAERAASEFYSLFKQDKVVYGPMYTMMMANCDKVLLEHHYGKDYTVYFYHD